MLPALAGLLLLLILEKLSYFRRVRSIPLRICVAGTRGKSSLTRILCSVLSESGLTVLAKTTGSLPAIILPDGTERTIIRRGNPSILEAKKIIRTAEKHKAQALVYEMMSIQPETMMVEGRRLIRPHLMVITNIRPDHIEHLGDTEDEISWALGRSIPEDCTLFIPEREIRAGIVDVLGEKRIRMIPVSSQGDAVLKISKWDYPEDINLACAVAEYLGIDREKTFRGISRKTSDLGRLKVWRWNPPASTAQWLLVNGFSANDPKSTRIMMDKLSQGGIISDRRIIALLNLRKDRADRTLQWIQALKSHQFPEIEEMILVGDHADPARKRLAAFMNSRNAVDYSGNPPLKIMTDLAKRFPGDRILVGMGNIAGVGMALIELWAQTGENYDG